MASSEGAESNNYLPSGGQFNVPEKLSLDNFTKTSTSAEHSDDAQEGENNQVRDGIYNKTDKTPETVAKAAPAAEVEEPQVVDAAKTTPELKPPDLVERYDPAKPIALLKLFGDLIITHEANTQMPDTRIANAAKGKPPAAEAVDEDHNGGDTHLSEKMQLAFNDLKKHVPRESEILDRVMQTFDRLARQAPRSQFDNRSEIA